jgi:hypothetical protein
VSTRTGLLAYQPASTHDVANDFSPPRPTGETDSLAEESGFELPVPLSRKGFQALPMEMPER